MFLYALIDDNEQVTETREFATEQPVEGIRKSVLTGLPVLRPVITEELSLAPYQVLRGYTFEVFDDHAVRHNVIEDRTEEYRARSLTAIDEAAETARKKYITAGDGQAMTYTEKANEARDFKASAQGDYPLLTAEIGITGETRDAVAEVILDRFANFKLLGAAIEKARLTAKGAIAQAESGAAIKEIIDSVVWP